jgi:hypothetical protein
MYQREALWIFFSAASWKPNAVKLSIGNVNVVSGELESGGLKSDPQNYIVCPDPKRVALCGRTLSHLAVGNCRPRATQHPISKLVSCPGRWASGFLGARPSFQQFRAVWIPGPGLCVVRPCLRKGKLYAGNNGT